MNKKIASCAGVLLGFLANSAWAEPGQLYLEGKGGGSWGSIKSISAEPLSGTTAVTVNKTHTESTRWMYGGAIGYQLNSLVIPLRIETEYMYRNRYPYNKDPVFTGTTDQLRSDIINQTVLGNLFIDIPVMDNFLVFIGGGGGVAFNRTYSDFVQGTTTTRDTTDRVGASWMASAGLAYQATDWLALSLSYRYSDLGPVRWSVSESGMQMNSHNFKASEALLGFRLTLPAAMTGTPASNQAPAYKPQPQSHSQADAAAAESQRRQQAYGNMNVDK